MFTGPHIIFQYIIPKFDARKHGNFYSQWSPLPLTPGQKLYKYKVARLENGFLEVFHIRSQLTKVEMEVMDLPPDFRKEYHAWFAIYDGLLHYSGNDVQVNIF